MSVLLDALKKAAEDKKRAQSGLAPAIVEPLPSVNLPFESDLADEKALTTANELKLSLTQQSLEVESNAAFNADLDAELTQSKNASFNVTPPVLTSVDSFSTPSSLPIFKIKHAPAHDVDDGVHGKSNAAEPSELSLEDLLQVSDAEAAKNALSAQTIIDNATFDDTSMVVNMAQSKVEQHSTRVEPVKSEAIDRVEPLMPDTSNAGFEWRLEDLPAYAVKVDGLDSKPKLEPAVNESVEYKNPILVSGVNRAPAKKAFVLSSSSRLMGGLLVTLVFISLLFYGLTYYQQEEAALEQSMQKYVLAKRPVSAEPEKIVPSKSELATAATSVEPNAEIVPESSEPPMSENDLTRPGEESANINGDTNTKTMDNAAVATPAVVAEKPATKHPSTSAPKVPAKPKVASPKPDVFLPTAQQEEKMVNRVMAQAPLHKAYSAYEAGDYLSAHEQFNQVLSVEPNNTTALIGLGNIAGIRQDLPTAMDYYQRALAVEPNNLAAFESIAHYASALDLNADWGVKLSQMALEHPRSAVLQNALGNHYAKEQQWHDAQTAYFNAVALEPASAQYLTNLAISLDHLGQYSLAATHYTHALVIGEQAGYAFNAEQIKQRLAAIRQFLGAQ